MNNMSIPIIESIINILYPQVCVGCNRSNQINKINNYICNECYYDIKKHIPPFCSKCGRGLQEIKSIRRGECAKCSNRQYYFQQAWSVCSYEGLIKDLIHRFKYKQKVQYKTIFRNLFHEFFENFDILKDVDFIIPIPLHSVRLREREYNQSQILATMVSEITQKPVNSDILSRRKNTKSQIDLDEKKRIKNISGCFAINNPTRIKSKSILLMDDVLTTGTTLSEAAKAINQFDPGKVYVLTLAS
ncbi:double zinc ribbon domain-containing protein [Candidatus Omnitrophota bacterium]